MITRKQALELDLISREEVKYLHYHEVEKIVELKIKKTKSWTEHTDILKSHKPGNKYKPIDINKKYISVLELLNTNKPNISNIHMLIPFMNNLDILTNKINNSNIINDIIKDTDNDTDNDFDCLESIFIDKYKMPQKFISFIIRILLMWHFYYNIL